jgi:predicted anti-sigma-YlaC factor YlaD
VQRNRKIQTECAAVQTAVSRDSSGYPAAGKQFVAANRDKLKNLSRKKKGGHEWHE